MNKNFLNGLIQKLLMVTGLIAVALGTSSPPQVMAQYMCTCGGNLGEIPTNISGVNGPEIGRAGCIVSCLPKSRANYFCSVSFGRTGLSQYSEQDISGEFINYKGGTGYWSCDHVNTQASPSSSSKPRRIASFCDRTIKLRSWKGDYLHRADLPMDNPNGVGAWNAGVGNDWIVECVKSNTKIRLRSWKGDYLHRADLPMDNPNALGIWNTGIGNEWDVDYISRNRIKLRSWKKDYLHRADLPMDNPNALGIWNTGVGNEWTIEVID